MCESVASNPPEAAVKPDAVKNDVVVYCDVTIAAPLLFSFILSKKLKRKPKRLYIQREKILKNLKEEYTR